MEKGISPIVAVVLLIAITVIAAIGIHFWMAGLATKQPTPETPVSIVANPIGHGKVLIANLGQKPVNTSTLKTSEPGVNITCEKKVIGPGEQVLCEINESTSNAGTIAIYGKGTGSTIVHIPKEEEQNNPPGASNSPPKISNVWDNTDGKVTKGSLVTFYANVSDPDNNLDKVILYTNITGTWASYEMNLQSDDTYYFQKTADVEGTIEYYVVANDTKGQNATSQTKSFLVYTPGATVQWYETYDWAGNDEILSLFTDSSGIYMTGYEKPSSANIKTAKADLSGNLIWNKTLGDSNSYGDYGNDITVYKGVVYITGQYWINSDHWHDNVIVRYDADTGNYLGYTASGWTNRRYDRGLGILALGDSVYSVGYGDASGGKDANLLKASLDGTKQFFKWTYSSSDRDEGHMICSDGTYLYTTGLANGGNTLMQKIAQDGTVVFNKVYDIGNGQKDYGKGIVYLNNSLFVVGRYYDSNAGHYNMYISKLDLDGNIAFTKKYDFGYDTDLGKITTDGTYIYGIGKVTKTNDDGLLFKLDQSGNLLWNETFDLGGNEALWGVSYYNGLIYTGGYTDSSGEKDWLLVVWKENGT